MVDMHSRKIVVTADDLGLSRSFNKGITQAAHCGILTSTCLRVNGSAYTEAVNEFVPRFPEIGLGVHLNLTEGNSLRTNFARSRICDGTGVFRHRFAGLCNAARGQTALEEIKAEFRDQIERALKDVPKIDHLNSHQHVHGIPSIFKIACELAREYNIPYVRLARERRYYSPPAHRHASTWYFANTIKWTILNSFAFINIGTAKHFGIDVNDRFIGILYTGFMNGNTILTGLSALRETDKVIEILLHPAVPTGARDERFLDALLRDYVMCLERLDELATLQDRDVRHEIGKWGELTNYRALAEEGLPSQRRSEEATTQIPASSNLPDLISPTLAAEAREPVRKLRTYVLIDETELFHPWMLKEFVRRCEKAEVVEVGIVQSRLLSNYMLKNIKQLRLRELIHLTLGKVGARARGKLPRFVRGDFNPSVEATCRALALPYRSVTAVNTDEFVDHIKELDIDLIVSSNSLIFGEQLLAAPKRACINRHSALLPSYRGVLPVFRAVQFRESHTGATVHTMVQQIDKGLVLSRKWVPIFPEDTLYRLYGLCFTMSVLALLEAVDRIYAGGSLEGLDREGRAKSYYSFPDANAWREFRESGGRFA